VGARVALATSSSQAASLDKPALPVRWILGNPLTAITMIGHGIKVG
jgi:hypothetical protein